MIIAQWSTHSTSGVAPTVIIKRSIDFVRCVRSLIGKAPGCEPGRCGFESRRSPQLLRENDRKEGDKSLTYKEIR